MDSWESVVSRNAGPGCRLIMVSMGLLCFVILNREHLKLERKSGEEDGEESGVDGWSQENRWEESGG